LIFHGPSVSKKGWGVNRPHCGAARMERQEIIARAGWTTEKIHILLLYLLPAAKSLLAHRR
jgi:hypothetical protein